MFTSLLKLPEEGETQREGCEDGEEEEVEEDYVSWLIFVITFGCCFAMIIELFKYI